MSLLRGGVKPLGIINQMRYLFYDVETTGLPKKGATCAKKIDDWPRIVQVAWTNYSSAGVKISGSNVIVKPDGYTIPDEVAKIHRITTDRALAEGRNLKEALGGIAHDLSVADVVICHNTEFDINVLNSEFHRMGFDAEFDILKEKKSICTMKETIDFCALEPKVYGTYKYPKLEELHIKLFGEGMVDAHDAQVDTEYLAKCFFELVKLGIINVNVDPIDFYFNFGKFKGRNLVEVFMTVEGQKYVLWLMGQKWFKKKHYKLARACEVLLS